MATIIPTEELYRQYVLKEREYSVLTSNAIIYNKEINAITEFKYHLNSHLSLLSYLNDEDRETAIAVRRYLYNILFNQNNNEKIELSDIEKKVYETAYWYLYRLTRDEEGMYLRPSWEVIKSTIHLCFNSYELSLLLESHIKRLEYSIKNKKSEECELKSNNKISRDRICDDLLIKEMIIKERSQYKLEFYGVKEVFNYINQKARNGYYDIEPCKPTYDFMRKSIKDKNNRKIEYPSYYDIEI